MCVVVQLAGAWRLSHLVVSTNPQHHSLSVKRSLHDRAELLVDSMEKKKPQPQKLLKRKMFAILFSLCSPRFLECVVESNFRFLYLNKIMQRKSKKWKKFSGVY